MSSVADDERLVLIKEVVQRLRERWEQMQGAEVTKATPAAPDCRNAPVKGDNGGGRP